MRIGATADLHGFLPDIPDGLDLLLVAGDVGAYGGKHLESFPGKQNTLEDLGLWMAYAGCPVVGIAGNHDFAFERDVSYADKLPWTYLQDEGVMINGVNIYGTPWVPSFGPWAFMLPEEKLESVYADIPKDTEILISHGPSSAFGGVTATGVNAGSEALARRIRELPNLKLHVFGHIHEGYGYWHTGRYISANVSHVDLTYLDVNPVMVFDI